MHAYIFLLSYAHYFGDIFGEPRIRQESDRKHYHCTPQKVSNKVFEFVEIDYKYNLF